MGVGERARERERRSGRKEKREGVSCGGKLLVRAGFCAVRTLLFLHTQTRTHTRPQKPKAEVDEVTGFQSLRSAMAQGSDSNDTTYKSPSPASRTVSVNFCSFIFTLHPEK